MAQSFALMIERVKSGASSIAAESEKMIAFIEKLEDMEVIQECKSQASAALAYVKQRHDLSADDHNAALLIKATVDIRLGKVLEKTVRRGSTVEPSSQIPTILGTKSGRKHISSRTQALAKIPFAKLKRKIEEYTDKGKKASLKAIVKEIREESDKQVSASLPNSSKRYKIYNSDVSDLKQVDDNSVDCIVTDPPYPQKYLPLYGYLSETAARVLKTGGSCVVMVGHSWLPEIMAALATHLKYHWMLAYLTPGGQAVQLFQKNVNTFWKPVLWFVKDAYSGPWIGDVCKSDVNANEKDDHHWGQSESGMADLLGRMTQVGQTVLDPFCGGGTTGVVAVELGRFFIGSDIDDAAIATTKRRLSSCTP